MAPALVTNVPAAAALTGGAKPAPVRAPEVNVVGLAPPIGNWPWLPRKS
jgi:hypothetical protein